MDFGIVLCNTGVANLGLSVAIHFYVIWGSVQLYIVIAQSLPGCQYIYLEFWLRDRLVCYVHL